MQIKTPDCLSSSLSLCSLSFFSWLSTVPWAPSSPRYKLQSSAPAARREKGVEANPSEELVTTLWAKLTEWRGVLSKEKSRSTVKPVSPSSRSFLATDFFPLPPPPPPLLSSIFLPLSRKLRMHSQLRTPLCGVIESIRGKGFVPFRSGSTGRKRNRVTT